jgi:hypothetical protein
MNFLTRTMLAGTAICALSTAPALAAHAPNIHLAGMRTTDLKLTVTGISHQKTPTHNPKYINYTTTINETLSAPETALFHKFNLLYAWAFFDGGSNCHAINATKLTFKATPTSTIHKIKKGSVTGTYTNTSTGCIGLHLTYYGPNYKLLSSTATSDSFTGKLEYHKTTTGYNLSIVTPTSLTITH